METLAPTIPVRTQSQDLDIIVLGRAGMDLYPAPTGTKTKDADQFQSDLGGSAGNIAVALSQHGLSTGLIAPVSEDPVGDFVRRKLREYGITHLTPAPVKGSSRTSLAIAENRADDCQVVIYRNDAADFQLNKRTLNLEQLGRARALIVTGTALAQPPSRETTLTAMARAAMTIIDLDYRAYSWRDQADTQDVYLAACEWADIIVGNDEEFDILAPGRGLDWARQAATRGKTVIYKMGAKGSIAMTPETEFETGIFPVKALKPFGAGDAFMGGLIACLSKALPLDDAIKFGSACAAIVVSSLGCASAMPTTPQTQAFIAAHQKA